MTGRSKQENDLAEQEHTAPSAKDKCRYCKSNLKENGALLCKECNHWQVPLGWLIPKLSLADLVLYGSVAVVLLSTFNVAIFGKKADLVATPISCGNYRAELYISNDGNDQAIMTSVILQAIEGQKQGPELSPPITHADKASSSRLILADHGRIVELALPSSVRADFAGDADINSANCFVRSTITAIVDAAATKELLTVGKTCSCSDFAASH